ncbi:MAG: sigma-70 family RNA polymerase sigma factor [Actinomycetota bacterium]|jgi:RNA polymerase sigma factor (sigma-70 family)|nr:sigma-70 family RNA polymerase sigma factor [Actinomycetota bacterium]
MTSDPPDRLVIGLLVQAERTAARLVGAAAAEDIASETVTRALVRWRRVSGYPHAWVTRVATNLAIDTLHKQHRPPPGPGSCPQGTFEADAVQRLDVVRGLRHLSRRQQQVVVLHYLVGLTDEEVSEVLGVTVPTVKTHLGRALSALRRLDGVESEEAR